MTDEVTNLVTVQLRELRSLMETGFNALNARFDSQDERLDKIEGDISVIKSDIASLKMEIGLLRDQNSYMTARLESQSRAVQELVRLLPHPEGTA
jgi:chromosome segregation ATPase